MKSTKVCTIWTILALSCNWIVFSYANTCRLNDTDISALNSTWVSMSADGNTTYKINLCRGLVANGQSDPNSCHAGTSICMIHKNGTVLSIGNFTTSQLQGQKNPDLAETWTFLTGDRCLENPAENMTTGINMKCGPTLGSPNFLNYQYCVTYFEWESNVHCTGSQKAVKEVPCYVHDAAGRKYDLSPLARKVGGYEVASATADAHVYINVCRDIGAGAIETQSCPSGSGACRVIQNSTLGIGDPSGRLMLTTDGSLQLHYTSNASQTAAGCTTPPSTMIKFICPKRGGSRDPLVVESFDCQYVIEWHTEYACPESSLVNNSCVLTKEDADIDIDLRPLTKLPGVPNPYKTSYTDHNGVSYDFYLNVCGELGIPCPKAMANISACQTKPEEVKFGRKLGNIEHSQLRYADNELTLTYKGGEPCHTKFQRWTIINFICNRSAVDGGKGKPVFNREDECMYFFDWETKYACLEHPVGEMCQVDSGGKRFDLSSLVRTKANNWVALHETTSEHGGQGMYFINVCHDILPEGDAVACPAGAAACYKQGHVIYNLGRYRKAPTYDTAAKSIQLVYTDGGICIGTKRISSTITFICKPGDMQTGPSLIRVSPDGCLYEFEWHTAAACVLGHYSGTNCKVYDEDAGFNFDLSALTLFAGDKPAYYTVDDDAGTYEYLINVCGPLNGTKCDNSGIDRPGICQVKKSDPTATSYVTGQWSQKLTYYDGLINLTYTGGSPYHDEHNTPRESEIAFLCDPNAGIGTPKFLTETNKTYGFEWYTAFACPSQPLECTTTDEKTNQQYDLSSLSLAAPEGNWVVEGTDKKKYYINVCRPLNRAPVHSGCGTFAAVCRTTMDGGPEKLDIANMGEVSSGLRVESEGQLKLTYVGPSTCHNGTATVPYKTNIEFLCERSSLDSHPGSPRQDGPCEYTVVWDTVYACPLVADIDRENCTVKDPNSGYIFNLRPLTRADDKPYVVNSTDGSVFKLNICGNVSTQVCSETAGICQVKNGTQTILGSANSRLDFSETGRMVLIYEALKRLPSGGIPTVEINFICSPDVDLGHPVFLRHERNTHIFEFATALACSPMPIDCFVQDHAGNQYELGTLSNTNGYSVLDTRDDKTKYFINVCRPINNMPGAEKCKNEPIGGCQVASNNVSYNMGYIQSKPIATADGTLTIHYRNGDLCHKGKPNQSHRSTRINFYCSETEDSPVFEAETELCEYIFNWRTPAACPLKSSTGNDCKVVDPRFNYQFDLSPLRKSDKDYHVKFADYDYVINVCGPLVEPGSCNLTTSVASCQAKPLDTTFTPIIAGKASSKLKYAGGELTLTYTGGQDKCHGQYERQTTIKFICDQAKNGSDGPKFIAESENCHYLFTWATSHACAPFKVGPCATIDGNGHAYDLSSLSRTNDNYDYTDPVNKKRYIFNVCRSLIHKKNATCPYNSAVCMVDLDKPETDPDKYKNVGEPNNHQILYRNGRLVMVYDYGDVCNWTDIYKTHITFICDKTAVATSPTGHFKVGNCDHHFMWTTAAACPLGGDTRPTGTTLPPSQGSCTVRNPQTGYVFNLNSLTREPGHMYSVDDGKGHVFDFNVCGRATHTPCGNTSSNLGVCQVEKDGDKRSFNAGNFAKDLQFDDGVLALNYTSGDLCHGGKFHRNTIFSFVCKSEAVGEPVYVDESDECTYYFAWHTSLACENEVKCTVDVGDSNEIDLSKLSTAPFHLVLGEDPDGSIFYLSVCRPLVPLRGVMCPPGSGVCKIVTNGSMKPMNLGKPKSAPSYNAQTGDITLQYTGGENCTIDPSKKLTSEIIFTCKVGADLGSPVLVQTVGCHYVFQWDTNAVCVGKVVPSSDSCAYREPQTGALFNLTTLQRKFPYKVDHGDNTYLMNMCGPADLRSTSVCNSAMVCLDGKVPLSYGEPKDFDIQPAENMLKLTYAAGGPCADDANLKAQSHILLQCDRSVRDGGEPQFLTAMGCHVVFLWKTNVVCPPLRNPCAFVDGGHMYDLSLLSQDTGSWNLTDASGNSYWINVCGAIHHGPGGDCSKIAGACRKTKDGIVDTLGTATSQKPLYFKDGAIVLEYLEGSPACSHKGRRSDSSVAKTIIKFKCGNTYGGPKYIDSDNNTSSCTFEFTWETKLACEVERDEVESSDGVIEDPRSGGAIDLRPIMSQSYKYTQTLQSSAVEYIVQLDGNMTDCHDGVVCSRVHGQTDTQLLGAFTNHKFYMDDDILEAVYTSGDKCKGDASRNISSIIQFHCDMAKKSSTPVLLYQSKGCMYVFTWVTHVACIQAKVINPIPGGKSGNSGSGDHTGTGTGAHTTGSGTGGGVKGKTIATIVGVFVVAIALCILLVVFHKPERRASCFNGMRRLVRHRSSQYTQLPQTANGLPEEEDILEFLDPADTESNQEGQATLTVAQETNRDPDPVSMTTLPASYHDDSDEDPLLA